MNITFKNLVVSYLDQHKVLEKNALMNFLKQNYPEVPDATLNWRIHQLKEQGLIQSMGYGRYALTELKQFTPELSSGIKRIHNKILKELPYSTFCVWESKWFNEFMLHQLFRNYQVIEVEKESVEAVFNTLTDFSKKVFLNPSDEIFNRYIANFNEVIIVKTLITESPINQINGIHLASLEKLLVDCLADKDLFAAQQNEIDFIFKSVTTKYNLSLSKMTRYAGRRGQGNKIALLKNNIMAMLIH